MIVSDLATIEDAASELIEATHLQLQNLTQVITTIQQLGVDVDEILQSKTRIEVLPELICEIEKLEKQLKNLETSNPEHKLLISKVDHIVESLLSGKTIEGLNETSIVNLSELVPKVVVMACCESKTTKKIIDLLSQMKLVTVMLEHQPIDQNLKPLLQSLLETIIKSEDIVFTIENLRTCLESLNENVNASAKEEGLSAVGELALPLLDISKTIPTLQKTDLNELEDSLAIMNASLATSGSTKVEQVLNALEILQAKLEKLAITNTSIKALLRIGEEVSEKIKTKNTSANQREAILNEIENISMEIALMEVPAAIQTMYEPLQHLKEHLTNEAVDDFSKEFENFKTSLEKLRFALKSTDSSLMTDAINNVKEVLSILGSENIPKALKESIRSLQSTISSATTELKSTIRNQIHEFLDNINKLPLIHNILTTLENPLRSLEIAVEQLKTMTSEEENILSNLNKSFENVNAKMKGVDISKDGKQLFKELKCLELNLSTLLPEIRNSESLKILTEPLDVVLSTISAIHVKSKTTVKSISGELQQPIIQLCHKVHNSRLVLLEPPLNALLEILDDVEKCENISTEIVEVVSSLKEPLEELNEVALTQNMKELNVALKKCRIVLESVTHEVAKVKVLEMLVTPLNALLSVNEDLEKMCREPLKESIIKLNEQLDNLEKQNKMQKEVLSIVELKNPLLSVCEAVCSMDDSLLEELQPLQHAIEGLTSQIEESANVICCKISHVALSEALQSVSNVCVSAENQIKIEMVSEIMNPLLQLQTAIIDLKVTFKQHKVYQNLSTVSNLKQPIQELCTILVSPQETLVNLEHLQQPITTLETAARGLIQEITSPANVADGQRTFCIALQEAHKIITTVPVGRNSIGETLQDFASAIFSVLESFEKLPEDNLSKLESMIHNLLTIEEISILHQPLQQFIHDLSETAVSLSEEDLKTAVEAFSNFVADEDKSVIKLKEVCLILVPKNKTLSAPLQKLKNDLNVILQEQLNVENVKKYETLLNQLQEDLLSVSDKSLLRLTNLIEPLRLIKSEINHHPVLFPTVQALSEAVASSKPINLENIKDLVTNLKDVVENLGDLLPRNSIPEIASKILFELSEKLTLLSKITTLCDSLKSLDDNSPMVALAQLNEPLHQLSKSLSNFELVDVVKPISKAVEKLSLQIIQCGAKESVLQTVQELHEKSENALESLSGTSLETPLINLIVSARKVEEILDNSKQMGSLLSQLKAMRIEIKKVHIPTSTLSVMHLATPLQILHHTIASITESGTTEFQTLDERAQKLSLSIVQIQNAKSLELLEVEKPQLQKAFQSFKYVVEKVCLSLEKMLLEDVKKPLPQVAKIIDEKLKINVSEELSESILETLSNIAQLNVIPKYAPLFLIHLPLVTLMNHLFEIDLKNVEDDDALTLTSFKEQIIRINSVLPTLEETGDLTSVGLILSDLKMSINKAISLKQLSEPLQALYNAILIPEIHLPILLKTQIDIVMDQIQDKKLLINEDIIHLKNIEKYLKNISILDDKLQKLKELRKSAQRALTEITQYYVNVNELTKVEQSKFALPCKMIECLAEEICSHPIFSLQSTFTDLEENIPTIHSDAQHVLEWILKIKEPLCYFYEHDDNIDKPNNEKIVEHLKQLNIDVKKLKEHENVDQVIKETTYYFRNFRNNISAIADNTPGLLSSLQPLLEITKEILENLTGPKLSGTEDVETEELHNELKESLMVLQSSVTKLKSKISQIGGKAQKGILSILDLEEPIKGLEKQLSKEKTLEAKLLSKLVTELATLVSQVAENPQQVIPKDQKQEIQNAVTAIKMSIEQNVLPSVAKQSKVVTQSWEKLLATMTDIEQKLLAAEEVKPTELQNELKESLTVLQTSVTELKSKISQVSGEAQKAVLSILDLEQPIKTLQKQLSKEETPEAKLLSKPVTELATLVSQVAENPQQVIPKDQKQEIQNAVTAIKMSIEQNVLPSVAKQPKVVTQSWEKLLAT
ncbi:hypothetical protein FQR65_LT04740 [Abscondita terminalis]|nr:hypothetical protein FQR65_LT04740 [Abscondita terminalis]